MLRLTKMLAVAALAGFSSAPASAQSTSAPAPPAGCIRGTVLTLDGKPIPNVAVVAAHELDATAFYCGGTLLTAVERRAKDMPGTPAPAGLTIGETRTDNDGRFQFDDLASGRFTIVAVHPEHGIATTAAAAANPPDPASPLSLKLPGPTSLAAHLRGLQLDPQFGYVNLETESATPNLQLDLRMEPTANPDEFTVGPILSGHRWKIVVWGRNQNRAYGVPLHAAGVELKSGQHNRLTFNFAGEQTLAGRVLDPQGEPLPDVAVRVRAADPAHGFRGAFTSADGKYSIAGLAPGEYDLEAVRHRLRAEIGCGSGPLDVQASKHIRIPLDRPADADLRIEALVPTLVIGDAAPLFSGRTIDEQVLKLADYRGRVVLLDFWATWCGLCLTDLKHIAALHAELAPAGGFAVISISLDADPRAVERFLKRQNLPWPQLVLGPADRNPIARLYNVMSTPTTIVIDREGRIAARNVPGEALGDAVRKLFK